MVGMPGFGLKRRVMICALLVTAMALSVSGSADVFPDSRAVDGAAAVRVLPGVALDAGLGTRPETLTVRWADHVSSKARPGLGLAMVAGMTALLALGMASIHNLGPGRPALLRRSHSVALRAPPTPRLV